MEGLTKFWRAFVNGQRVKTMKACLERFVLMDVLCGGADGTENKAQVLGLTSHNT